MNKKEDFLQRKDGKIVSSEVLNNLPSHLYPEEQTACHICPNALWFTELGVVQDSQGGNGREPGEKHLSVFCRLMNTVIWESQGQKAFMLIKQCDGTMPENDPHNQEG
ncbi:relaxosome accessory protein [Citrobacter sp. NCU1]|nr:relaxosome accessory protein [Citrobacter sp. NCU1]